MNRLPIEFGCHRRRISASIYKISDPIINFVADDPDLLATLACKMIDSVWKQLVDNVRQAPRTWLELSIGVFSRFFNLFVASMLSGVCGPI